MVARGCVYGKLRYGGAAAVIGWALANWGEFDGWCVVKGVNPLELPVRRFANLVVYALLEGLDKEAQDKMKAQIAQAGQALHPFDRRGRTAVSRAPKSKPKPPPGWKSDEEAYRIAQAFIAQLNTGFKNG